MAEHLSTHPLHHPRRLRGPGTGQAPVRATAADSLRVAGRIVLPSLASGVVVRRPGVLAAAQKWQWDASAISTMQELRARHGGAPVRLRVAGREVVLLVEPADVARVLGESPEPFALATTEKAAALAHFQPHGVLIETGGRRRRDRRLVEEALEPERPLHELAPSIVAAVREEMDLVARHAHDSGSLTWEGFAQGWWRAVRRVVLGSSARDDEALTDDLAKLRANANWAYLRPRREAVRERFTRSLRSHLARAEPGALASLLSSDAEEQVPHWLFASDAAGIATFRALHLVGSYPHEAEPLRAELADVDLSEPQRLDQVRAAVLESVRLWPTTPLLLRQSTEPTVWGGLEAPTGTTFAVFTPFFHRDWQTLTYANRFQPRIWLDGEAAENPALVPFSDGPGVCPGRNLVLLMASTALAALLEHRTAIPTSAVSMTPDVPATVNHFALSFRLREEG
ncbi:cytochrome P450 [Umezawaea sp. Da 62-37]|uniref:cytochrome P450 n=1 Tax=Umezawaea sp. Da 62-37 TaxID=3075927 RepID=UPI0028F7192F|nr:cytochrome P450 [Umezawaea sp. Da 62-37]WNV86201.1 cytochrome P450 [Umezawaea sp. Da 62-37]